MISWKVAGHDGQLTLQARMAQAHAASDHISVQPKFMCGVCRQEETLVGLNQHLLSVWVIFTCGELFFCDIWELIFFFLLSNHIGMGFKILANMISSSTQIRFELLCRVFYQKLISPCLLAICRFSVFIHSFIFIFLILCCAFRSQALRFTYQIQFLSLNHNAFSLLSSFSQFTVQSEVKNSILCIYIFWFIWVSFQSIQIKKIFICLNSTGARDRQILFIYLNLQH